MRTILRLIGLGLLLVGIYFLGQNIYFSTNPYPYWWRGIAANASILSLTIGVLLFFILPRTNKSWVRSKTVGNLKQASAKKMKTKKVNLALFQ